LLHSQRQHAHLDATNMTTTSDLPTSQPLPRDIPTAADRTSVHLDARRYHELRDQLTRLHSAPVPDMAAIDDVIKQLTQEQFALKAADGQPGNNPIEASTNRPAAERLGHRR
jgi:hypothetical protein